MKISWYNGNIYDSVCRGHLTMEQWVEAQRNPKPHVVEILKKIAEASKRKDYKLKQQLKTGLYYITPSVNIKKGSKRRYDNIEYFTGYAQIDMDKLNSIKEAKELRDYIFDMYDTVVCSYLSPSKLRVKAIMKITRVNDVEEYKDIHKAIETELSKTDKGWDHATFNCVLPLFISSDPDIRYRSDAKVWTDKEDRTVDYVHLNKVESEWGRERDHATKSLYTIAHFKEKMEAIIDGDGHPRLRSACLVLGSRAGADYIDLQQATELAHYMIDTNPYLRSKKNTYLKTADWCLRQGYTNPSYY